MANILVEEISETSYAVTVEGYQTTTHQVSISADYARTLTQGNVSNATLVKASFKFLLERESNSSILRSFDLKVIERYFPEYPNKIAEYFA